MKILLFSIFLMTVGILVVLSAQNVKAMPDMSPQDLYKQSDTVFYGQVITKESGPGPDYYYYQVKVSTFFKNPQTSDSITVAGHKPSEGHMVYQQFEVGDKVVFYIVKQDGILVASPWSIKAGEGCDIHAFLGPAPIPGEPIVRSPPSPLEQVTDANITTRGPFKVNQALLVSYHVWNNFPQSRNVPVQLSAINQNDTTSSYYKNQTVAVGACDASTINWIFSPTKVGYYIVNATENGKFRAGEDFEVVDSKSDASINSKFVGSPLMQLKSGISAQDVKCKSNLQLVIKTEDGSPACVRSETAQKLAERGWAQSNTLKSDLISDHIVDVISIKSVGPVNPGGPDIQLTLKNTSVKSITNLKATLELNNSYVFDFKDVTKSQPLTLGNSVSDTKILIGAAGITTTSTYPLTVSGVADGIPFSYTMNVNLP